VSARSPFEAREAGPATAASVRKIDASVELHPARADPNVAADTTGRPDPSVLTTTPAAPCSASITNHRCVRPRTGCSTSDAPGASPTVEMWDTSSITAGCRAEPGSALRSWPEAGPSRTACCGHRQLALQAQRRRDGRDDVAQLVLPPQSRNRQRSPLDRRSPVWQLMLRPIAIHRRKERGSLRSARQRIRRSGRSTGRY